MKNEAWNLGAPGEGPPVFVLWWPHHKVTYLQTRAGYCGHIFEQGGAYLKGGHHIDLREQHYGRIGPEGLTRRLAKAEGTSVEEVEEEIIHALALALGEWRALGSVPGRELDPEVLAEEGNLPPWLSLRRVAVGPNPHERRRAIAAEVPKLVLEWAELQLCSVVVNTTTLADHLLNPVLLRADKGAWDDDSDVLANIYGVPPGIVALCREDHLRLQAVADVKASPPVLRRGR